MKVVKCVSLDKKTSEKVQEYGENRGLSFSAALRMIVNEFFIREAKHG